MNASIGGIMGLSVGGGQMDGQEFLTSGIFNIPSGIKFLDVLLVAGGGSGGKYEANTAVAGGGGAGEILFGKIFVGVLTQLAITIGAGGARKSTSGNGNAGGNSSIGSLIIAKAGSGGRGDDLRCAGGVGGGHYFSNTGNYANGTNAYRDYSGGTGGYWNGTSVLSGGSGVPIHFGMISGIGGAGGGCGGYPTGSGPGGGGHSPWGTGGGTQDTGTLQSGGGGAGFSPNGIIVANGSQGLVNSSTDDAADNTGAGTGGYTSSGATSNYSGEGGSGYALIMWVG